MNIPGPAQKPLAQPIKGTQVNHGALLATDSVQSVMQVLCKTARRSNTPPYGYCASFGSNSLLGFVGEPPDSATGHYLLGNGYRAFNPVLMRFNSPDALSPFDAGGLNAYAYCAGDPVNRIDPDGRVYSPAVLKAVSKFMGLIDHQPKFTAFAPRLTRSVPKAVKAQRSPPRLIANLDDSAPLPNIPEGTVASTPAEWYLVEGSIKELSKHARRYKKSARDLLREKRQDLNKTLQSHAPDRSQALASAQPATEFEALQIRIANARRHAGRLEPESLLGPPTPIRGKRKR